MLQKLKFNLTYYKKPVWDTGISPKELTSYIASHPPGKALDLGCGTGTNVITLAKSGWQVTGVDFAPRAILIAKKKVQQNGMRVKFLLDDVTKLDSISDCFNLILDMGCFHNISPNTHSKYIANINRLLTPDGTFMLYVFYKIHARKQGPGVTDEDIAKLLKSLVLERREDGTERGMRTSAWLIFKKPLFPQAL